MASTLGSRIATALSTNAGRRAQYDLYNEFYTLPPAARVAIRNEIRGKLPQDMVKSIDGEMKRPGNNPAIHIVIGSVLGLIAGQGWATYHNNYTKNVDEYYKNANK